MSIYNLKYDRLDWTGNAKHLGEFYEGKERGMGKFTFGDGRKYDGEYKKIKRKENEGAVVAK